MILSLDENKKPTFIKGTVMQMEKTQIYDRLRNSKNSWKFCIPTIYHFAVIYL